MALADPRVITIEGKQTLVVERQRPIPPTLKLLLEGGRDKSGDWRPLRVADSRPVPALGGTRPECMAQDHRLRDWIIGFHTGSDAIVRALLLQICVDCGAVCVRDRSTDTLELISGEAVDNGLQGRRPLRRKSEVIGWYTGARPRQRVYT